MKLYYRPRLGSNIGALAVKMNECWRKRTWFSVSSLLSSKTTFWAGSQVYVETWPALRNESGWSSSQRTSNTIGTRGGKKNYDNGDYYDDDDDDDDDDDYDDADEDDDEYNVFSSSQRTSNRDCTRRSR